MFLTTAVRLLQYRNGKRNLTGLSAPPKTTVVGDSSVITEHNIITCIHVMEDNLQRGSTMILIQHIANRMERKILHQSLRVERESPFEWNITTQQENWSLSNSQTVNSRHLSLFP